VGHGASCATEPSPAWSHCPSSRRTPPSPKPPIQLKAGLPGTHTAALVTAGSFATGIVIATFWGTVLAIILTRYARRPARTFTVVAAAATALSLITPLDAFGASLGTKLTLAGGHLIVASIMTTILRRGISHP
jgi:hypothetical protein